MPKVPDAIHENCNGRALVLIGKLTTEAKVKAMYTQRLRKTPFSVVDFETTGLSAKSGARIVEVAIARADPGESPRVVLDTLVDPEGPVFCTGIHGITEDDVLGAPRFTDLLGELVTALQGSVVGAFNASFDMAFLMAEAKLAPKSKCLRIPPHVCLMWLRPLIGLGNRCCLDAACEQHGIEPGAHQAAADALACAYMWQHYVDAAEAKGIHTWSDLASAGSHKYLQSLSERPYSMDDFVSIGGGTCPIAKKPRMQPTRREVNSKSVERSKKQSKDQSLRRYWGALVDAFADGLIDQNELAELQRIQSDLALPEMAIRSVHARLFADCIRECAEDRLITDDEAAKLRSLRQSLTLLGWAPG